MKEAKSKYTGKPKAKITKAIRRDVSHHEVEVQKAEKPKQNQGSPPISQKKIYFFKQEIRKTRSRPEFQVQPAKLQLPMKKNYYRRTEKAPNRRKRRGSNPASPNKWTSPAPAARPYRASWYHVETKLSLCPAFINLLQGNFKIVTTQGLKAQTGVGPLHGSRRRMTIVLVLH